MGRQLTKLASAIAKREGKKSQARIGDIREILKIVCTIEAEELTYGDEYKSDGVWPLQTISEESNKIADRLSKKKKK